MKPLSRDKNLSSTFMSVSERRRPVKMESAKTFLKCAVDHVLSNLELASTVLSPNALEAASRFANTTNCPPGSWSSLPEPTRPSCRRPHDTAFQGSDVHDL